MTIHFSTLGTSCRKSLLIFSAAVLLSSTALYAEDQVCRSKTGAIKVTYPEVARKMKIAGTVRLQLQLGSNGSVREVKVLGGNPLLASAAQQAVRQAKFEGDSCVINFDFKE